MVGLISNKTGALKSYSLILSIFSYYHLQYTPSSIPAKFHANCVINCAGSLLLTAPSRRLLLFLSQFQQTQILFPFNADFALENS